MSLHETIVIDRYGGPDERRGAREPDEKHDWRKLVGDPELKRVTGIGGMCFYDAAGLRFHLPAYLSLAVIEPDRPDSGNVVADLIFTTAGVSDYNRERLAVLNVPQRSCVKDVLKFLRAVYNYPENGPLMEEMDQAINGFWSTSEARQ